VSAHFERNLIGRIATAMSEIANAIKWHFSTRCHMNILKIVIRVFDDGSLMLGDAIEYQGKLWLVPVACGTSVKNGKAGENNRFAWPPNIDCWTSLSG
jgi:hypothetical protein